MANVGIVGISGYSGGKALEILLKHEQVRVTYVSANNTEGKIDDIWPKLKGRTKLHCAKYDEKKALSKCDVLFLAVPHKVAMTITPNLLKKGKKVIDLSGDYRLFSTKTYKKYYKATHTDAINLKKAVYGLPELYRESIKEAELISNPGCYPTAIILALAPIVTTHSKKIESVTVDAKSGVSGAGKKAAANLSYCELNENFKAYKILEHQHTPEIEQYLTKLAGKKMNVDFVPHLLPASQGLFATVYVRLKNKARKADIRKIYRRFYKTEPFVRVLDADHPQLKNVVGTNYCDIGLSVSTSNKLVVITSAIDNLVKGAAGQAVQNMNLMCGFEEGEALSS